MNSEIKRLEEMVKRAEAFLEEHGLNDTIQELCDSEEVQALAKEHYQDFVKKTEELFASVPESRKEATEHVKESFHGYTFEVFMNDFKANFEVNEYKALAPILNLSGSPELNENIIEGMKEAISSRNEATMKEVSEVLEGLICQVGYTVGDMLMSVIAADCILGKLMDICEVLRSDDSLMPWDDEDDEEPKYEM